MKRKTFNFIASVKNWNNGVADKNGKMPILLKPFAGTSPRGLNVISGTSAELQGFKVGTTCVVSATEGEPYDDGDGNITRSFNFDNIAEVSPIEALAHAKSDPLQVVIAPEAVAEEIEANA